MGCGSSSVSTTEVEAMPDEDTPTTPVRAKKVRDVFFLLLFLAALGGMGYLARYSMDNGDPGRYIKGIDSWGNVCGRNNTKTIPGAEYSGMDHTNNTFEFHTALSDLKLALNPLTYLTMDSPPAVICVSECPTTMMTCKQLLTSNGYNLNDTLVDRRVCTMPYGFILPHSSLINRCIPSLIAKIGGAIGDAAAQASTGSQLNSSQLINSTQQLNLTQQLNSTTGSDASADTGTASALSALATSIAKMVIESVVNRWKDTIYLILIALAISFLMILFLQLFTRVVLIAIVVTAGVGSVALTGFLWYNYAEAKGLIDIAKVEAAIDSVVSVTDVVAEQLNVTVVNSGNILDSLSFSTVQESSYLLPCAVIVTVVTIILLLILIWSRKSLSLVVKLFDEASLAVFNMPLMLLQPFVTLIVMIAIIGYFVFCTIFIVTVKVPQVDDDGLVTFVEMESLPILHLFIPHLIGCLWMLAFVSACQEMILAGSVCNWFFSRGSGDKQKTCNCKICPTAKPILHLILYNLGTVAIGSLIVAIVQTIRIILGYIQSKLKGQENKFARYILKALSCCMACFEKILKYINRNAYICAAMYGEGFCASGKRAFNLLLNNIRHMMVINCMGGFCILMGRIAVTILTGFAGIAYFKVLFGTEVSSTEYVIPSALACLASYVIASCFFNVYGMAVDTIFLCFCDDQQRNNGDDRPYYSSKKLQKYMTKGYTGRKKNKKKPKESARSNSDHVFTVDVEKVTQLQKIPRPKAAKRNRTDADGNKEVLPQSPFDIDQISTASADTLLVDKFDSLVDKMMARHRMSPLSKRFRALDQADQENQRSPTPFPPINSRPQKLKSASTLYQAYTPLPGQVPHMVNERESHGISMEPMQRDIVYPARATRRQSLIGVNETGDNPNNGLRSENDRLPPSSQLPVLEESSDISIVNLEK
ncbi:choline transporter-like protein 1 [Clavelina lepadiformis]|uniref:choline transporter-like protein 1 n=1 Tax=Clavelina lepadiformis TaxID=159417 RepID=UPI004041065C